MTEEEKKQYIFKIKKAASELFNSIEGNIDSIINDLFTLQYEQQDQAINYIINYLTDDKTPILK